MTLLPPRARTPVILFLFVCVALAQTPELLQGRVSWDERFIEYFPWRAEAARLVHEGEFPFYTDRLGGGMPLMSTAYVGVYYPLNAVYLWLRPVDAGNLLAALHAFLALAGLYFYLRSRRLSRLGAFAGSLVFGCGTFMIVHAGHVSMNEAACLSPWVAWAARRLALRPALRRTGLLAAVLALQISIGYLQVVLIALGWVAVEWAASSGLRFRREPSPGGGTRGRWIAVVPRRFVQCGVGILVAGGVAEAVMAVQILPTLRHVKETPRAGMTLAQWQDQSFDPVNALIFFSPRSNSRIEEQWITLGTAGLALFAASLGLFLFARRRFPADSRAFLWTALLAMSVVFLMAMGSYFGPNVLLFHLAPFNLFRIPSRWLLLAGALGACAGAMGLDVLIRLRTRDRLLFFFGAWVAWGLLLAVVHALALRITPSKGSPSPPLADLLFTTRDGVAWQYAAVGLAALAVCFPRRLPGAVAGAVLVAAVFLDFRSSSSIRINPPQAFDRAMSYPNDPFFRPVRRSDIVRYFTVENGERIGGVNLNVFLGIPQLVAYCPLVNRRVEETLFWGVDGNWRASGLYRNASPLELLGVTHAAFPEERIAPAPGSPTPPESPYEILNVRENNRQRVALVRLRHPLPRFDFAPMWSEAESPSQIDRTIWAERPAVEDRAVLIESPHYRYFPNPRQPVPRGTITVLDDHASRKRLRVKTPGPTVILIRDVWWPGWRYWIENANGRPVDTVHGVYRAQGLIQAVPVPGGEVTVDLRYRPPDWRTAVTISVFGLLCLALLGVGKPPALPRR